MRIMYVSSDWSQYASMMLPASVSWYRCSLPASYLAEAGHEVIHTSALYFDRETGKVFPVLNNRIIEYDFDVVVLQRWMHEDAERIILSACEAGQVVINDVDDYFEGLDFRNQAYETTDPSRNPEVNRDHYRRAIAASTAVTTTTPFLKKWAEELGVPAFILPNYIDLERWTRRKLSEGRNPVVGWAGATSHRSGDLEAVWEPIRKVLVQNSLTFHHSGYQPKGVDIETIVDLSGVPVSKATITPITAYPAIVSLIEVGIVPLRECDFNEAKSWIKGLEYAAAGVPFVASPSRSYQDLEEAEVGRVAHSEDQWIELLEAMLDPDWRNEEADRNANALVAFDFAERWKEWEHVYEGLLS